MLCKEQYIEAWKNAVGYMKVWPIYQLGFLDTEKPHPKANDLHTLTQGSDEDIAEAARIFQSIDVNALDTVLKRSKELEELTRAIRETIRSGGKIFFYGCGATGRLSLSTGYLWRYMLDEFENLPLEVKNQFKQHIEELTHGTELECLPLSKKIENLRGRVVDFMTGGDVAQVNSIENAEDYPELAVAQLKALEFGKNDLVVGSTEGGETPSVLAVVLEAAEISRHKQFLTFCNPTDILMDIERSRKAITHKNINTICLDSGPMALAGSTRLQATTMQEQVAKSALLNVGKSELEKFRKYAEETDFSFLVPFIKKEVEVNQRTKQAKNKDDKEYIRYRVSPNISNVVYTDITERNPTFSYPRLKTLEEEKENPAPTYIVVKDTKTGEEARYAMTRRSPNTLDDCDISQVNEDDRETLERIKEKGSKKSLLAYDFSENAKYAGVDPQQVHMFDISLDEGGVLRMEFEECEHEIDLSHLHPESQQLYIKMMMNMHSTLFMGRLGRFKNGYMTYCAPTNNKLFDRNYREADHNLKLEEIDHISYEKIFFVLFEEAAKFEQSVEEQENEQVSQEVVRRLIEANNNDEDVFSEGRSLVGYGPEELKVA